ncbi:acyltransferase family protein [Epilithonimonas pallida]|uniref:Acyltransferase 3 domain-containing protein n=1 Tax=Epilithonimonas pallida TaxID=373671 RepID=A0ABY1R2D9_9FLAO|nr:acyltransferase family protein [Epilithonimonas pallida]SMP90911.1 hypothetical protein SAMN05421679_102496 [Epilithonimonas pallida]
MYIVTENIIGNEGKNGIYIYLFFPAQLPVFAMGIILYFFVIKQQSLKAVSWFSYLMLGLLYIASFFLQERLFYQNYMLFAYFSFGIAILLSKKKLCLLDNRLFRQIGTISYSLYIIHFIIFFWLARYHLNALYLASPIVNFILFFSLTLILSSAFSYLTYQFIEKPFQNLGKKLIMKEEKPIFAP